MDDYDDTEGQDKPKRKGKQRYSTEELGALIRRELDQSLGAPDSEISQYRVRNLQYFQAEAEGELAGPSVPDRSSMVASDVADTVEWMLPALVRVFAQSQDSMDCEPRRPQFEQHAKRASEYLRHCFWANGDGMTTTYQWFKDALIQKVGFVRVDWCDEDIDTEESYRGLVPEQVQQLLSDSTVEAVSQAVRTETLEGGQEVQVYDLTIKRQESSGKCKVSPIPPEEMRIHARARYTDEPLFVAHVCQRTRGELEAEEYDLADIAASDSWSTEAVYRTEKTAQWWQDESGEFERFEVSECYIRLDQDMDGTPEWRRVLMIGDTVVEDEKTDGHPFVWFCPSPLPHTFFGNCPADFAIQPQKLNTSLLRSLMDNVYLSVNKRMGVLDGRVNLDDLLNPRPGGIVRMKEIGALMPIEQGGVDPGAWRMVEWAEQWRERRTGFTRMSQGMSPDALNHTASGVQQITEKADQRIEMIARIAAASMEQMFQKMLKCMSQYQSVNDVVKLMGEWVSIDPREWREGFRIRVNVGLGTGSKDRRAMALQQVYGMQQPLAQRGALPPQALIETGRSFADAAGLGNPNKYFPDAPPPQQPPPPPEIMIKQMELQADAQKFQADSMRESNRVQMEAQAKQAEQQAALELQASNDERDSQREQMRDAAKAQLEAQRLELDRAVAAMKDDLERWKTVYDRETQLMLAGIAQANRAPAEEGFGDA